MYVSCVLSQEMTEVCALSKLGHTVRMRKRWDLGDKKNILGEKQREGPGAHLYSMHGAPLSQT